MASGEIGQALRRYVNDGNLWIPHSTGLTNEVLGRMQAAQGAEPTVDLMDPTHWNAGATNIKPECVPWPYAQDDIGTAFDQANLWGIRFVGHNPEQNHLVAVPRQLPSGYMKPVARGQWQSDRVIVPATYFSTDNKATWLNTGLCPASAPSWLLRSPPGSVDVIKQWGPANFANKSTGGATIDYNIVRYYIDIPTTTQYAVTFTNRSHIGYRGGKISIYDFTTAYSHQPAISVHVGWKPAGVTLTGWPDMPTEIWSGTWSDGGVTEFLTNPREPSKPNTYGRMDFNFSLTPPNALGDLVDFYMWSVVPGGWSPDQHVVVGGFSPRADVPYWFDVVGINDGVSSDWHAPGGYLP